MTIRITIACPENLIADANQFALCVGNTVSDMETFGPARWEDQTGARFALASLLADDEFPSVVASPLIAPAHAPQADLVAAERAQSRLEIWSPASEGPFPEAKMGALVAVVGLDAGTALALFELTPTPAEE